MGLILDSSVLIAAERLGQNARQALIAVASKTDDPDVGISTLTLMELAHGAARANTPLRKATRLKLIEELLSAVPIYAVTSAVALRAGTIDGERRAVGVCIPVPDLLNGVTALDLGYGVGTTNPRHFALIPGLTVTAL